MELLVLLVLLTLLTEWHTPCFWFSAACHFINFPRPCTGISRSHSWLCVELSASSYFAFQFIQCNRNMAMKDRLAIIVADYSSSKNQLFSSAKMRLLSLRQQASLYRCTTALNRIKMNLHFHWVPTKFVSVPNRRDECQRLTL